MKKAAAILRVILLAILVLNLSMGSVFASEMEGQSVNLVSEDSGYTLIVPDFIEQKTVQVGESEVVVLVMKTPKKDENGDYSIFEIVTTNEGILSVESFPKVLPDGESGWFWGDFKDGSVIFKPEQSYNENLSELSEELVYSFDLYFYGEGEAPVFYVTNINFMFVDDAETEIAADPVKADIVTANPTGSTVMVDGSNMNFEAYEIGGNNYFKLRDLAMAVNGSNKQFQVTWDGANNAINLITNTPYTSVGNELVVSETPTAKEAALTQSKILLNGEEVQLTAYSIGGNNYFKLRDIGKIIDFAVTWNGTLNMIGIDTSNGYTE